MFWMIIIITLTGSLVVGSVITAFLYSSSRAEPQAASAPATPTAVQKGTPVLSRELEGKVVALPTAECPLNGQEAIPGTVVVRVIIDRTGQVKSVTATGGDWLLRGAASEAAMKSTFAPEKLRRRETEGTITYTFEP
jgi:outer membrane biosynthesis protein TonB